jgi:hypothetical protein
LVAFGAASLRACERRLWSLDNHTNRWVCQHYEHGQANSERLSGVDEAAFFQDFASNEACAIAAAEHPAP